AGGIADHAGEVADEKDDAMAELLEVPHLAHHHGVTDVDVGRGRIESDFDRERLTALQLRAQVVLLDEIDRSLREERHLLVERQRHGGAFYCSRSHASYITARHRDCGVTAIAPLAEARM